MPISLRRHSPEPWFRRFRPEGKVGPDWKGVSRFGYEPGRARGTSTPLWWTGRRSPLSVTFLCIQRRVPFYYSILSGNSSKLIKYTFIRSNFCRYKTAKFLMSLQDYKIAVSASLREIPAVVLISQQE